MTFKIRSWPDIGDVTDKKQCTGLVALEEKGDTWDLEGEAQDICSIWCLEISRKKIEKDFPFDGNWEV